MHELTITGATAAARAARAAQAHTADVPAPPLPDADGVRRICDSIRDRNRQIEVFGYDGWWSMHVPTELMALVRYAEIGLAAAEREATQ